MISVAHETIGRTCRSSTWRLTSIEVDERSEHPSCVFGVRNLRGMAKGEQDARRGSVFDV
jgi:hypothetical protein